LGQNPLFLFCNQDGLLRYALAMKLWGLKQENPCVGMLHKTKSDYDSCVKIGVYPPVCHQSVMDSGYSRELNFYGAFGYAG
jgi:hypothetical protein